MISHTDWPTRGTGFGPTRSWGGKTVKQTCLIRSSFSPVIMDKKLALRLEVWEPSITLVYLLKFTGIYKRSAKGRWGHHIQQISRKGICSKDSDSSMAGCNLDRFCKFHEFHVQSVSDLYSENSMTYCRLLRHRWLQSHRLLTALSTQRPLARRKTSRNPRNVSWTSATTLGLQAKRATWIASLRTSTFSSLKNWSRRNPNSWVHLR